jgi:hypothetical protein
MFIYKVKKIIKMRKVRRSKAESKRTKTEEAGKLNMEKEMQVKLLTRSLSRDRPMNIKTILS